MDKSTKITEIKIFQPREHLISHLERLLDRAKTGELTGLISVTLWQGNNVSHGWSLKNGHYLRTMIGEIEILKHALIDEERHIEGTAQSYD